MILQKQALKQCPLKLNEEGAYPSIMCIKKFYPRIKCQSVYCMKGLGCKESAMLCLWGSEP